MPISKLFFFLLLLQLHVFHILHLTGNWDNKVSAQWRQDRYIAAPVLLWLMWNPYHTQDRRFQKGSEKINTLFVTCNTGHTYSTAFISPLGFPHHADFWVHTLCKDKGLGQALQQVIQATSKREKVKLKKKKSKTSTWILLPSLPSLFFFLDGWLKVGITQRWSPGRL